MIEIHLPDEAWADVEDGTEALLDEWLVAVGDNVASGQPVAVAIVAKTKLEVLAPAAGTVRELRFPTQESFGRGQAIATLEG